MGVKQNAGCVGSAPKPSAPDFDAWYAEAQLLVGRVMASPRSPSIDVLARLARNRGLSDDYVSKLVNELPEHLAYASLVSRVKYPPPPMMLDLATYAHRMLREDEERRRVRELAENKELGLDIEPDYSNDVDPFDHIEESPESVFGHDAESDEW